jgi:hypothetical protein
LLHCTRMADDDSVVAEALTGESGFEGQPSVETEATLEYADRELPSSAYMRYAYVTQGVNPVLPNPTLFAPTVVTEDHPLVEVALSIANAVSPDEASVQLRSTLVFDALTARKFWFS